MNKIKKNVLIILHVIIWFLFILNLLFVIALADGVMSSGVKWKEEWPIAGMVLVFPFLFGYLLRNHFRILFKLIIKFFRIIPKTTMKCLLFLKDYKLTLPTTILLGCIVLGSFFYATQVIKQRSIEKQQKLDLQVKTEQNQKEYIATRKKDCFDIYNKEKDNWDNTRGSEYDEVNDKCYIIYKAQQGEWANTDCKDISPAALKISFTSYLWKIILRDYQDCLGKQFRKEF
ncbi:MAG: hypothetical protein AAB849_01960 [Patescibacteria group bacterium]